MALFSISPPLESWIAADHLPLLDSTIGHFGRVGSVLIGLLLLYLAGQLRRRRRGAWRIVTLLLGLSIVASVIEGPHWVRFAASAVPLGLLLLARRSFVAPSDPPTLFRLVSFLPIWALTVIVFGVGSLWLERRSLTPTWSLERSLATVGCGLVGEPGSYRFGHPHFAHFFGDALLALSAAGAAIVLWLACRPVVQRPSHSADDMARARELIERFGDDTLAYFALRADKSWFFSSDGGALVAYGYFNGYALASGDPIGSPDASARIVAEFVAMCRDRGWGVAFLAVREDSLPLYHAQGLHSTYLGDEAILDCRRFDLQGPRMRGVRLPVNKLRKRGYSLELIDEAFASSSTLERLREISTVHRAGEVEHGFTMALGAPLDGTNAGLMLAIARNPEGAPQAFLRFVPCFGDEPGLSLDLMRRHPRAPNGIVEFLIAETALALRERGIARLSLNFAAYRRFLEDDLPLTPVERILRLFVLKADPLFQTRSLWTFNRKFQPDWLGRSLVYESSTRFPFVVFYYILAEGFVRIPLVGRLLVAQPRDRPSLAAVTAAPPSSRA